MLGSAKRSVLPAAIAETYIQKTVDRSECELAVVVSDVGLRQLDEAGLAARVCDVRITCRDFIARDYRTNAWPAAPSSV